MTIGSILVGLALLVIIGLVLARPFLTPLPNRQPSQRTQLLLQKEKLLDEIGALDFDFETDKLPEEVYQPQRERLLQQAEAVLKELDELKLKRRVPLPRNGTAVRRDIDAEIEAAIKRQRQQPAVAAASSVRPTKGPAKAKFCPECGSPTDESDKFCVNCGHRLLASQPA
ncbi:MAG: zinc ribbon domain-containing protein [Anaerolineae bacterium]